MDWDFFFRCLEGGSNVGEICFYFSDEPGEPERFIGFMPDHPQPYWAGLCDIPDGCGFPTVQELVNAPIYGGRSLRERWDKLVLVTLDALSPEEWREHLF